METWIFCFTGKFLFLVFLGICVTLSSPSVLKWALTLFKKLLPYIYGTSLDKEEMYDLKPHADAPMPAAAQGYRAEEEEEQINYDMIQVMQDIDEIFGEPITDWSIHYYSVPIKEISIFIAKYNNIVIYYAKSAHLLQFGPVLPTLQYKSYI